jgi:hypothetical protein
MPPTYKLINSSVLTSSASSVDFTSIPATYTDLVLRLNAKQATTSQDAGYAPLKLIAGSSSAYSTTSIYTAGPSNSVTIASNQYSGNDSIPVTLAASQSGISWGYAEIYIPNYLVSQNHPSITFAGWEADQTNWNGNSPMVQFSANLFSNTSALSVVRIASSAGNFVSGSTFYLYGISNA